MEKIKLLQVGMAILCGMKVVLIFAFANICFVSQFGSIESLHVCNMNKYSVQISTIEKVRKKLHFQRNDHKISGTDENFFGSIWRTIRKFLPTISKARLKETYNIPLADSGNRYHVRLIDATVSEKRHIITRLKRYITDLTWQTAEGMVDTAIEEGKALIRVVNNKRDAADLVDMLKLADPPVLAEIYDVKKDEILIL